MKDTSHKSRIKTARKAAADKIEQEVLKTLKHATSKFKSTEEFVKLLEKSARKLSKKISKEITFEKEQVTEIPAEPQSKTKVTEADAAETKVPAKNAAAKSTARPTVKSAGKPAPKA